MGRNAAAFLPLECLPLFAFLFLLFLLFLLPILVVSTCSISTLLLHTCDRGRGGGGREGKKREKYELLYCCNENGGSYFAALR